MRGNDERSKEFLMIRENVEKILKELPANVELVAATKQRSISQIEKAIGAGIKIIGENYIQEAEQKRNVIGDKVKWHLIGHLQSNKVKKAITIFDMIESLDSLSLAVKLNKECKKINKVIPVLIEVNIAGEAQKHGALPRDVDKLVEALLEFENIRLNGLMTMGPFLGNPQDLRPYFRKAKDIFERIRSLYKDKLDWHYLSMGMSDSYKIGIEEGANMVRVGTAIFGERTIL